MTKLTILCTVCWLLPIIAGRKYKAAVYEHALYTHRMVNGTRQEAVNVIMKNAKVLVYQAHVAKQQGVDIIVFPEYGLTGFMEPRDHYRESVYPYMETVPEPGSKEACMQCSKLEQGREGQQTIACAAKQNHMFIVANLIENVPCSTAGDPNCPKDDHYQYNTNIVYNRNGCLVAKYHKMNLYDEEFERLDAPHKPEHAIFETEFGKFGLMICQDAVFKDPGVILVEKYGIKNIIFTTAWDNNYGYEFFSPVEWQFAFAMRLNVNFLASNVHIETDKYYGSGIYSPGTVVNLTCDPFTNHGKLLTAVLDSNAKPTELLQSGTFAHYTYDHSHKPMNNATVQSVTLYGDIYNAQVLKGLTGKTTQCYRNLCCHLHYNRSTSEETFILAAYSGQHSFQEFVDFEVCILLRCINNNLSSCDKWQSESRTNFYSYMLYAKFDAAYVFPSLMASKFQLQKLNWQYNHDGLGKNIIQGGSEWPLLSAALVGRNYNRDPQKPN